MRAFPLPVRRVLTVQPLEGRLVPAGALVATLSATGLLTVTGDDDDNGVTLQVNAGNVVLTPDAGTAVGIAAAGNPVTLPGTVKSIKVDLKGGADTLLIDGTSPFVVTGAVALALGDGNNTLDLTTTGLLDVGSLSVKAGDGADTATVSGGAGSRVRAAASFLFGDGGSTTTLNGVAFGLTVQLKAGDAIGVPNGVSATGVTVAKTFTANLGNSFPAVASFDGSTLGGLTATGNAVGAVLINSTVNGNVSVKAGYQADLQVDGAIITGSVALGSALPSLEATGTGTTINGNLTMTGTSWTSTSFQTTSLSEVKGNVTVRGSWYSDLFETNALFKVGKNLTLLLGGGDNTVSVGDGTAVVPVAGNLKVTGAGGADTVSLDRVAVTGTTGLTLLAGQDYLSIENGATFAKAVTADLGTGDDTISVAQLTGSAGPVVFNVKSSLKAGTGNDALMLGLDSVGSGGDANSRAVFLGTGHLLDGGFGLNFYDAASGQVSGVTPTGW